MGALAKFTTKYLDRVFEKVINFLIFGGSKFILNLFKLKIFTNWVYDYVLMRR